MYSSSNQAPRQLCWWLRGEGACLTCCNQKELTGQWIKRVKSLMEFWSERDVLHLQCRGNNLAVLTSSNSKFNLRWSRGGNMSHIERVMNTHDTGVLQHRNPSNMHFTGSPENQSRRLSTSVCSHMFKAIVKHFQQLCKYNSSSSPAGVLYSPTQVPFISLHAALEVLLMHSCTRLNWSFLEPAGWILADRWLRSHRQHLRIKSW